MKLRYYSVCFVILGCLLSALHAGETRLTKARKGFVTHLLRESRIDEAPDLPEPGDLNLTSYQGPLGPMAIYVSPSPKDGKRHPVILWLVGGFSNSIGAIAWTPGIDENDQSATGFREAGILMAYPSLRGGNKNPGNLETFYGEVDDVLAAIRYVATLDYVDPKRIYLGGHSTGGTLALLVAESTDQLRAVFALGPVGNVAGYGRDVLPFDTSKSKELQLRAPRLWLDDITSRTYVFEGEQAPSNIDELKTMASLCLNPKISFHPIPKRTHFSIIKPLVKQIAEQIKKDEGETVTMEFAGSGATATPQARAVGK